MAQRAHAVHLPRVAGIVKIGRAHIRQHAPGAVIQHHRGGVSHVFLREARQLVLYNLRRAGLHARIQRAVNIRRIRPGQLRQIAGKMRGGKRPRGRLQGERLGQGHLVDVLVYKAVLAHQPQNRVAALLARLGMFDRVKTHRGLNHSRQGGRLRDGQLRRRTTKVIIGSRLYPLGQRAELQQIKIFFQNFFFRFSALQ